MKLLVIGGSYFYGRVFVMQAAGKYEITVVNRGTYSMAGLGVRELRGDRRDEKVWQGIREDYDVIVDFCAYEKGDIVRVLDNIQGKVKQYIFISTVDVYERGFCGKESDADSDGAECQGSIKNTEAAYSGSSLAGRKDSNHKNPGMMKREETPLETRIFPGEAGQYIAGKVALEQEVRAECGKRGIGCTVLRPAVLYGPYNYAPRESVYIQMMVQSGILPHITGTDGMFQMVYVKDAAEAILRCLLNEKAYGQAYNLCQDKNVNYDSLYEELKRAACGEGLEPEELAVTAEEAMNRGIPLPFPVTKEESELCSNEKSRTELEMEYLDFSEGMARTYRAFQGVFGTVG